MTRRIKTSKSAGVLLLAGFVWMATGPGNVAAQPPANVHNAPESVTSTLEGNEADLLSAWRFLSGLAVRLLSGNEAELELLSGNAPEVLSGNVANLLSGNDPHLLAGNTLFSNNTVEIHIIESGNGRPLGALAKSPPNRSAPRAQAGPAKLQKNLQAKLNAVEAQAKAMAAKDKAQAQSMAAELDKMRQVIAELKQRNAKLRAAIEELQASKNVSPDE